MNRRRTLAIILLALAILIVISVPVWLLTQLGANVLGLGQPDLNGPPLTPIAYTRIPRAVPQAALTPVGVPGSLSASDAILMDADTGTILYEKNGEFPVPMASTTKIMTALIAIQSGKLDQMITVGSDAVNEVTQNGGSGANLVAGDQIKLQDLLYGLMLPSGDDAAVAIADGVAGSTQNFVAIMNVEAQRLHLYQTRYYNVDGLEATDNQGKIIPGVHYTTPYDLARLAHYAMSIPLFAQVVGAKVYNLPATGTHHAYPWKNINTLLTNYNGTLGIKTGWTPQAGGCLVAAAKRNGHTLISVVLDSPNETTRFTDAQTLLNWGFGLPVQMPQV
jgi:D-alanyl-D-alanine carboxypeptidase (penicillin-binding protein 5/6)